MTASTFAYPSAAVLFSGGTDSTLCAARTLEMAERVHLLTFQPGFVLFVDNARKSAARLAERFGADRVRHVIEPIPAMTDRFLWSRRRSLLRRYGFHMTSMVCLACRQAMHAAALAYCLEHGIGLLTDGSIRDQSTIPEQMEEILARNRAFYETRFGIRSLSPIYEEDRSDQRVFELGLARKAELKRQFIFFENQATCPFGVTADVYARLFFGRLMGDARRTASLAMLADTHLLIEAAVTDRIRARGLDLDACVRACRSAAPAAPFPVDPAAAPPSLDEGAVAVLLRFCARFAVATVMVPVGVFLGLMGLLQRYLWWFEAPRPPGPRPKARGGGDRSGSS